jgi:ABC-type uncharacterized transport system substrate-binding protein
MRRFTKAFLVGLMMAGVYGSASAGAMKTVLMVGGCEEHFLDIVTGLRDALKDEYAMVMAGTCSADEPDSLLRQKISSYRPVAIILFDNAATELYKRFVTAQDDGAAVIPSVSLMGIRLDKAVQSLPNSAALCYEVPILSAVKELQRITHRPLQRVGVVYRALNQDVVEQSRIQCAKEGIELVEVSVSDDKERMFHSTEVALKVLLEINKVDVLWVPNDNLLVNKASRDLLFNPMTRRSLTPVLVNVSSLVSGAEAMGTLAVVPDHAALVVQGAALIRQAVKKTGLQKDAEVFLPTTLRSVLNLGRAWESYSAGPAFDLQGVQCLVY